jgi:hypothetical protein
MTVLKENFGTIYDIIQELKKVEVDGETMEYILKQVGMEYQMLRQLMLTLPIEEIENLIEERKELKKYCVVDTIKKYTRIKIK